jgi:hypothetical protein
MVRRNPKNAKAAKAAKAAKRSCLYFASFATSAFDRDVFQDDD